MKLMSLEEHNNKAWKRWEHKNDPQPNGIACPDCNKELVDLNPNVVLTSSPPQKDIGCPWCDYRGYRVV